MEKKHRFLFERPFAHRGYHSRSLINSKNIPENSLGAFRLAIENNFSIEMDINLTKDLEIIVFHDFFLGRQTTKTGFVFSKNSDFIKQAKLCNNESVPTIEDALNLIDGRVPILLEIKFSKHLKKNLEGFTTVLEKKLEDLDNDCLVLFFLSGGGSALLPYPSSNISLNDKIKINELLLSCGANIREINTVRKHLSKIKGGNFLKMSHPAKVHTFILSDVIGDDLSSIASGPTVPDSTSFNDVKKILQSYKFF